MLEVPTGLPPGKVEVVIVIQPNSFISGNRVVSALYGIWADKLPEIDLDLELREIRDAWKAELEFLE